MQRRSQQPDNRQTLPRQKAQWVEAIVRWTRYDYVAVYEYPTTSNSDTVMHMYKGDMVQVSKRFRRGDWCLCQVGHVLGWVFLKDVRFMTQSMPRPLDRTRPISKQTLTKLAEDDTLPSVPKIDYHEEAAAATRVPVSAMETVEHQQILKPEPIEEPEPEVDKLAAKKSLIGRLINFFKK